MPRCSLLGEEVSGYRGENDPLNTTTGGRHHVDWPVHRRFRCRTNVLTPCDQHLTANVTQPMDLSDGPRLEDRTLSPGLLIPVPLIDKPAAGFPEQLRSTSAGELGVLHLPNIEPPNHSHDLHLNVAAPPNARWARRRSIPGAGMASLGWEVPLFRTALDVLRMDRLRNSFTVRSPERPTTRAPCQAAFPRPCRWIAPYPLSD